MFFFWNEFRKMCTSGGNIKKMFLNERDMSDRHLLSPEKKFCPLLWSRKVSATTPPPLNLAGLWRSRKISATTPPPHWILPAYGDPEKFLLLPPPPHWMWSACGDHGKVAPPQTKILATPLKCFLHNKLCKNSSQWLLNVLKIRLEPPP